MYMYVYIYIYIYIYICLPADPLGEGGRDILFVCSVVCLRERPFTPPTLKDSL